MVHTGWISYWLIIMWRSTGGFLNLFYFGILIFPIFVVGSCLFSYLHHIIILYITIVIVWSFSLVFVFPMKKLLFLLLIVFVGESLRLEIYSLFVTCLLFWIGKEHIFVYVFLLYSLSLYFCFLYRTWYVVVFFLLNWFLLLMIFYCYCY